MGDRQASAKRIPERELVCDEDTHAWRRGFGALNCQLPQNLKQWLDAS